MGLVCYPLTLRPSPWSESLDKPLLLTAVVPFFYVINRIWYKNALKMMIENFAKKYRVDFLEIAFCCWLRFISRAVCFVMVTTISVHMYR